MGRKTEVTKKFKTKLPKKRYELVFQQGVEAATGGWERISCPYQNNRQEQTWLDGYDSIKKGNSQ